MSKSFQLSHSCLLPMTFKSPTSLSVFWGAKHLSKSQSQSLVVFEASLTALRYYKLLQSYWWYSNLGRLTVPQPRNGVNHQKLNIWFSSLTCTLYKFTSYFTLLCFQKVLPRCLSPNRSMRVGRFASKLVWRKHVGRWGTGDDLGLELISPIRSSQFSASILPAANVIGLFTKNLYKTNWNTPK